MPSKQSLDFQLDLVSTLKDLMETKEEVYVAKMLKVRNSVIKTRSFMEGLVDLFNELRMTYRRELAISGKEEVGSLSVLNKTKAAVAVLLTASEKPYGEINEKIFEKFWTYISEHQETELVIAGEFGKEIYANYGTDRPFRYFNLPEEGLNVAGLGPLINHLIQYEEVKVFYGRFESFINQQGSLVTISGTTPLEIKKEAKEIKEEKFLFEPSLKEILAFFETQIFALVFRQLALESYLAQIGSRVISLEQANNNIDDRLGDLGRERRRWLKRRKNRKQQQNLVGMAFWG